MTSPASETAALWSVRRTAAYLDVAEQTVRDAITRGEITASRCGRRVLVHPHSVDALIARTCTTSGDAA